MSRNAFVDPQRRLIAFWSPKCGCTTVARWFLNAVLERTQEFRDSGLPIGVWLDVNGYAHRPATAYPLAATGAYRTVLFTRDPKTRVASAFINKFYLRLQTPLDSRDALEPFAREFLDDHGPAAASGPSAYEGLSFREFIRALAAAKRHGRHLDHHWDTQFPEPLEPPLAYPRPDHLVRLESFAAGLDAVHAAMGIEAWPAPVSNRTIYPADFVERPGTLGAQRTVGMLADRIALRVENLLDAETLPLIREIYAIDYERLPYTPPA